MSFINKILAQAAPGSVLTDLYTAPASFGASVTVNICNTGVFAETYRVSIALAGAADAKSQYIAYEAVIKANDYVSVGGIYLRSGDVVRVYASDTNLTFVALGTEGS